MAPKFTKGNTKTFQLFQRSENDPRNHTEDGPVGVFYETKDLNSRELKDQKKPRVINRDDLDALHDEFQAAGRRENEGEAALYGITFDDSNYDYMQHLQPIGQHKDAYFLGRDGKISESYIPPEANGRMSLQDLLNGGPAESEQPKMSFREHYQSQLPVQDAIAGLKPDMDPRLREVLEALEDEEYVENDEEDVFSELLNTGEVKDETEWRKTAEKEKVEDLVQGEDEADWEFAFRKFKLEDKQGSDDEFDGSDLGSMDQVDLSEAEFGSESDNEADLEAAEQMEARDSLGGLGAPLKGAAAQQSQQKKQKKKKRIGAKTDLSGYSMSSSANYRNEGLTLLDDKFDQVEEQYAQDDDEDEPEAEFDMSKERPDLESIMDDFLDKYVVEGKHLVKKVK